MKVESIEINFDNGYYPIIFSDQKLNEELRIEDSRFIGFMVSKSAARRYFKILEERHISFNAEYWPSGFDTHSDNPGTYLIEFNVCFRHRKIVLSDIHTEDTFLFASIGGHKSRINNGCRAPNNGKPRSFWCEKIHFVDKSAKKMLDFVLELK